VVRQAPLFGGAVLQQAPQKTRSILTRKEDEQEASSRYELIQPILAYRQDPAQFRAIPGVTSLSTFVKYLSRQHGVSESTYWRVLGRYDKGGLPALADRRRADAGGSRWFATHTAAAYFAAYAFLELRQSYRVCYETICESRELLGLDDGDLPSYETVRAWLKSVPPYLKAYAREGRARYQARMSPYMRRGYTEPANQIWVSDHMIHDVEVMNDCFDDQEVGAPIRLRFTALLDYRSRYLVGYGWCWEGSSRSIATALRRALSTHTAPEYFYADNGKDYLRVAKGARPGYLGSAGEAWVGEELRRIEEQGVLARLGISITHCIPRHPQSKHVERFFRTLHERFDKRWHQHYTGGASHLRPDATSAAMMIHRKALRHGELRK
jgi:putative transposase